MTKNRPLEGNKQLKEYKVVDPPINPNPILKISRMHRTKTHYYGIGVLVKYGKVFFQFATLELIDGSLSKGIYSTFNADDVLGIYPDSDSLKVVGCISSLNGKAQKNAISIGKRFTDIPKLQSQEQRDNKKQFTLLKDRLKKDTYIPLIIFDNTHE